MDKRIAMAVATGAVVALPLLSACGASTAPASSPAAPSGPGASTSAVAASPTPSTTPVDETKNVQAASTAFVTALFTIDPGGSYTKYRDRLTPLLTKEGKKDFEGAHFERALPAFTKRYGQQARSTTKVSGTPKVEKLTANKATVSVTYVNRIQQRRDGKWHTVKTSAEDTLKLPMAEQDGRWLVDDLD
jgi:hypothetical protein